MYTEFGKRIMRIEQEPEKGKGTCLATLDEGYGEFKDLHRIGLEVNPSGLIKIREDNVYPHPQCYLIEEYTDCTHMLELLGFFDHFQNSQKGYERVESVVKVKKTENGLFIFEGSYTEDSAEKLKMFVNARTEGEGLQSTYVIDSIEMIGGARAGINMDFYSRDFIDLIKSLISPEEYKTLGRVVLQSAAVVFPGDFTGFFGKDRNRYYKIIGMQEPPPIIKILTKNCKVLERLREEIIRSR